MDYLYFLQNVRESAPAFVNYFFVFVSEIALLLGPIFGAVVFWSIEKSAGATILLGYAGSNYCNQTVKNIACIYRPWILDSRLHIDPLAKGSATGYSFPSGHTTAAAANFLGIGVWQRKKVWVPILMVICTLLVAFSRNWLGAHTLKDVLVAILISSLFICITIYLQSLLNKNPSLDLIFFIAGIVAGIVMLIVFSLKPYPIDYAEDGSILVEPKKMIVDCFTAAGMIIGSVTGWFLERRLVKFTMDVSVKQRILRSVIGLVGFVLIFYGLDPVLRFAGSSIRHFVKYFLVPVWAFFICPLIFTAIEKNLAAKNEPKAEVKAE